MKIQYILDRVCKHSIRYKQIITRPGSGPLTVYLPNEMFANPSKPPRTMSMEVTLGTDYKA